MRTYLFVILIALLVFPAFAPAYAQDTTPQGPKYGEDSATCVMKISLYREFYKQWKASRYKSPSINDAVKHWKWVFDKCPRGTQNTFVDGIIMYKFFYNKSKEEVRRKEIIDTLMLIYDRRIENFPKHYRTGKSQVGELLGRKGVDLYQLAPERYDEVYNILKESVELDGNKSQSAVLVYYFRTCAKMVDNNQIEKSIIVDTYDKLISIVDYNIDNNSKKKEDYEAAKANIELTFEPYANCEILISIYDKKFNENMDNPDMVRKIVRMLDKKGCTESSLYFDATIQLNELDPNPESAFLIGKMMIKKEDYANAARYLKQGTAMEDSSRLADCHLLLADTYRNLKNFPEARTEAYKSLKYRPDDGNPYILIGDLYAASAKECGSNELTQKVAYWAAVDKYYMAKRTDDKLAEIAQQRINAYSKAFPSKETIFFHGFKVGESYNVECWINEATTVRASE